VIEIVSNGVIIPITDPRSIVVSVSAFIILLRFKCSQLASFLSLSLLINKYSNSIIIVADLCLHITIIS